MSHDLAPPPPTAPHWLNAQRLRGYSLVLLIAYAASCLLWLTDSRQPGLDFMAFWSAGSLAAQGRMADAYQPALLRDASIAGWAGGEVLSYSFSYPPHLFLFLAPLAKLPYGVALALWTSLGFVAYAAALRALAPGEKTRLLVLLACPLTFINFYQGQTAFFATAMFALLLSSYSHKPVRAGVCLALLSCKPHIALLVWPWLLWRRQWRVLAVATASVGLMMALSARVFGVSAWVAFWKNIPVALTFLDNGSLPLAKMPTAYATVLALGGAPALAKLVHLSVLMLVLASFVRVCRAGSEHVERALLPAVCLFFSPHLNDYDLCLLMIPAALFTLPDWRRYERELLLLLFISPVLIPALPVAWPLLYVTPCVSYVYFYRACSSSGAAARSA